MTDVDTVLGFDFETAKNASLWTVAATVLLALVTVWLVKEVVKKVLTVVILLAIAGLAWSQRAELTACADEVRDTVDALAVPDTSCTFFGQEVTVPGRTTLLGPDQTTTTTVPIS